jgi:phospholipase C
MDGKDGMNGKDGKDGMNAGSGGSGGSGGAAPAKLTDVGHVVVIYLENHSFDNLYGGYQGAEGIQHTSAYIPQIDPATKMAYPYSNVKGMEAGLPMTDPHIPANSLPNVPFDITTYVPMNQKTVDLIHRYYQEQMQINGGKMDMFVGVSNAKGLSYGYYPTEQLPLVRFMLNMPKKVTLLDHFFHAAFGGSFLNHHWLISAATPPFPNAPMGIVANPKPDGTIGLDGTGDGAVTPDGFAINTLYTVNTPHPGFAPDNQLVPNIPAATNPTIGDRLDAANVDWAWYSGGWNDAVAGNPPPNFQWHHQPFAYYESYKDGTPAKAKHLKDEDDVFAAAKAGTLPPVSFIKPVGENNEHPGYGDVERGEYHTIDLIKAVMEGPNWKDSIVIVTYDEHGGFWDHVPPPTPAKDGDKADQWGPGIRVPGIVFSPFAKGGIDSTVYDTTAILKLIETRWSLKALSKRDAAQADLSKGALSFAP